MKSKELDKAKDIKEKHDAKHPDDSKKSEGAKAKEKSERAAGLEKAAAQSEDPEKVFESDPSEVAGPTRDANLPPSEEELKECDDKDCKEEHGEGKHAGETPAPGVVDGKPVHSGVEAEPSKGSVK